MLYENRILTHIHKTQIGGQPMAAEIRDLVWT